MPLFNLPLVRKADYPALAELMRPHLPETYEGWLELCAELERPHWKYNVLYVDLRPANFAEYMRNAGRELDVKALIDFVNYNPWYDPD